MEFNSWTHLWKKKAFVKTFRKEETTKHLINKPSDCNVQENLSDLFFFTAAMQ